MEESTDLAAIRHIIHRFRDKAYLDAWENSEELHKLIEEVNNYSTPYLQKATGMETWFTLPDSKTIVAPPKWNYAATYICSKRLQICIHWSILHQLAGAIYSQFFLRTKSIAF
jgi:antibiotic biosynthesis monooxygenase (ABM) superfamily enzyme